VTDGAAIAADQEFLFPLKPSDTSSQMVPGIRLRFLGDVRFQAHNGMLFVVLPVPEISVGDNGTATLSVNAFVASKNELRRTDLATLTIPEPEEAGGFRAWGSIPVLLTEAGAGLFKRRLRCGQRARPCGSSAPAGELSQLPRVATLASLLVDAHTSESMIRAAEGSVESMTA
jgi:hypothetical protein